MTHDLPITELRCLLRSNRDRLSEGTRMILLNKIHELEDLRQKNLEAEDSVYYFKI